MRTLADIASRRLEEAGGRPGAVEEAGKQHEAGHFDGRPGYEAGFLGAFDVPVPTLSSSVKDDAAPLADGSQGHLLHYRNFSVAMSKSRRIALFTACNIEGLKSDRDRIARGKDKWYYDLRMDPKYQIGEELYGDNELDRGHLVRREDPVWGEHAAQANDDTFHFTNCSPQHSGFNQQTWLGLENYILQNSRQERLRVCVFTGPVFTTTDPLYRGVRLPRTYWKVVVTSDEGRPSATAYQVKQDALLQDLEFVFGAYKTFQISIAKVERMTGLRFGRLKDHDGFSNEEAVVGSEVSFPLGDWRAIRI